MLRSNRRKGIEEVYGSKVEAIHPGRLQALPQPGMTKTATLRVNSSRQGDARPQRSYVTANDYYITTNVPLNSTNMRAAPAKSGTRAVQVQTVPVQASSYGSTSNRRSKSSTQQQQQQQQQPPCQQSKGHFVPPEAKANRQQSRPLSHQRSFGNSIPLQMTQRTVYAQSQSSEMDPSMMDPMEKHVPIVSSRCPHSHSHQNSIGNAQHSHEHPQSLSLSGHIHAHPLQHQLHQQQHLPNKNNAHGSMQQGHQQKHCNLKMQHQHQHEQQQQQQVHHHQRQQEHLLHLQQQQQEQQQQRGAGHQRQRGGMQMPVMTEEEDDGPEEFFELMRQTVAKAVATTLSEVISRSFRDMATKIERISNDLELTNDNLGKLQAEVTNKVMHYGEENTRHFRYLCMKTEYDKMFYQRQQALSAGQQESAKQAEPQAQEALAPKPAPTSNRVSKQAAALNVKGAKQMTGRKMGYSHLKKAPIVESVKKQNNCGCRGTSRPSHPEDKLTEQLHSSSDQSVSVKSSQIDEVLGQLQRLCTRMNAGDIKEEPKSSRERFCSPADQSCSTSTVKMVTPPVGSLDVDVETPMDSMDEIKIENFQSSSDDLSSYSDDDNEVKFSGNTTARLPPQASRSKLTLTHSNNGAGDGQ